MYLRMVHECTSTSTNRCPYTRNYKQTDVPFSAAFVFSLNGSGVFRVVSFYVSGLGGGLGFRCFTCRGLAVRALESFGSNIAQAYMLVRRALIARLPAHGLFIHVYMVRYVCIYIYTITCIYKILYACV